MKSNDTLFSKMFGLYKLFFLLLILSSVLFSQTRSKIEGSVIDAETKEELLGVNILLVNTSIGAATDENGKFYIINVPVGTYQVKASMIGYNTQTVVDVIVSIDRITRVDFELSSSVIEGEEVVVVANRNNIHTEVSSTQFVFTEDQLESTSGVRDISTFLELQPGVTSNNGFLEIRGGSAEQTGTFVNGLAYNNVAVGNAETIIPLSSIDQISLLSGGFNAEYGSFRSGIINVSTKSGSKQKYHGTISIQRNVPHQKRFGPSLSDPLGQALAPYLDARVAFVGTAEGWKDDPYKQQQHDNFSGWIEQTELFNQSRPPEDWATPLDYYLLAAWMHMAIPDYEGLEALGYTVSDEQKQLFEDHARQEEGTDYNIDLGFGGPFPFISESLGDLTFFLSHQTKETYYVVPVSRRKEDSHVTMATLKSNPSQSLALTLDFLWKRQIGVSPVKPAFGDIPTSSEDGGFMPIDNIRQFYRISDRDGGINYWFDPPIFPLLDQTTLLGGLKLNHVLNPSTFWELALNFSTIEDNSPTGDNRNNEVVTHFGPFPVSEMPYGKLQFAPNNRLIGIFGTDTIAYTYPGSDALPGVSRRFRSKEGDLYTNVNTTLYRGRFDLVTQIGEHHYLKSGIEYNGYDIDHRMWLKWNNNSYNTYEYNYHRRPSMTGVYLQDQISYKGIVTNLGVRLDYFYGGGGKWPTGDPFSEDALVNAPFRGIGSGDLADSIYDILSSGRSLIWEYWEQYDQENPGFLQPVESHFIFSPRLGISFPVTENSKFYFNYGHFRSPPPYYSMYLVRYRYTKNGIYEMSNPNLAPPRTISYELGFVYNIYYNLSLSLAGYYKDVTGQQGEVNFRNVSGTIDYDNWLNNNYEDIQGLEINITKSDNSWLTGWINFNYMLKKSGLTGREIITDVTINNDQAGQYAGQEETFLPSPRLSSNISFRTMESWFSDDIATALLANWQASFLVNWKSGEYFTWNPLGNQHVSNNLQWPDYFMVNLRLSKSFDIAGINTTLFLDVRNVFNNEVSLLSEGYAFNTGAGDDVNYLASLRLPIYDSPEYDELRETNPGQYLPGDDQVGDLRSSEQSYINDPNYTYFIYGQPRDIWFGLRLDF